jgi:hypothetical protein
MLCKVITKHPKPASIHQSCPISHALTVHITVAQMKWMTQSIWHTSGHCYDWPLLNYPWPHFTIINSRHTTTSCVVSRTTVSCVSPRTTVSCVSSRTTVSCASLHTTISYALSYTCILLVYLIHSYILVSLKYYRCYYQYCCCYNYHKTKSITKWQNTKYVDMSLPHMTCCTHYRFTNENENVHEWPTSSSSIHEYTNDLSNLIHDRTHTTELVSSVWRTHVLLVASIISSIYSPSYVSRAFNCVYVVTCCIVLSSLLDLKHPHWLRFHHRSPVMRLCFLLCTLTLCGSAVLFSLSPLFLLISER